MFTSVANAMGSMQGQGAQGTGGILASMVPLVLMIAVFYFLLIRPQQKKAKAQQEMLNAIKKGDSIITTSGLYGTVEEVHEEYIMLKLGEMKVKAIRSAVSIVITPESIENPKK